MNTRRFGVRILIVVLSSLTTVRVARAGAGFTLVATEQNTRDMSVNLGTDALRGEVEFSGRKIQAPTSVAGRDALIPLLNHDDGVLDVQHTFFINAALSSRTLIHFQTLKDELKEHCWSKGEVAELRAKLRLYVIPPYAPATHYRLWGIAPTVYTPTTLDIDPPPASVPIGVFRQLEPWVEGPGQNSFFTATYAEDALLDVKRVGVATSGTWHGAPVEEVDVCLNREPGLEAVSWEDERIPLCYDDSPDFEPWVEWDVSEAVRFWLEHGFDPSVDHGFALYQYPGESADDQARINTPVVGWGRSRAVVSFASSSAEADCPGAGGEWGGPGGADLIYSNTLCMSPTEGDLEPGDLLGAPRFITPLVRRDWAPQLVIEGDNDEASCEDPEPIIEPPEDHIASFRNANGDLVSAVAPEGTRFERARARALSPDATLSNVDFPLGFVGLTLTGFEPGAKLTVELVFPSNVPEHFYAFGPTLGESAPHWYTFDFDGTRGAVVDERSTRLYLIDGDTGDQDLAANGRILLEGGLGAPRAAGTRRRTDATVGLFCALALSQRVPSEEGRAWGAGTGFGLVLLLVRRRRHAHR